MKKAAKFNEASERLEHWRAMTRSAFVEIDIDATATAGFYGSLTAEPLGDIQFAIVASMPQHVRRTAALVRGSASDDYLLSVQLHGRGIHKQDGRVASLQRGDFALYDTAQPYELLFGEPFSQLVLTLPRHLVTRRMSDPRSMTARTVQGRRGSGRLASQFIRQLANQLSRIGPDSAPRLHDTVIDLIAIALTEQYGDKTSPLSRSRRVLLQAILQEIEDRLGDQDLNCTSLAQRHRISDRTLRSLFEDLGCNASDWIWQRRLERAKSDLSDPSLYHRPVSDVGYHWGFKDAAHFSRAFKAHFGYPPGVLRSQAAVTNEPSHPSVTPPSGDPDKRPKLYGA